MQWSIKKLLFVVMILFIGSPLVAKDKTREYYLLFASSNMDYENQKIASFSYHHSLFAGTIGLESTNNRWKSIYEFQYVGGRLKHFFTGNEFNPEGVLKYDRFIFEEKWFYRLTPEKRSFKFYLGSGFFQQFRLDKVHGGAGSFVLNHSYGLFRHTMDLFCVKRFDNLELRFRNALGLWYITNESEWNAYHDWNNQHTVRFLGISNLYYSQDLSLKWTLSSHFSIPIGIRLEFNSPRNKMDEKIVMKQLYIGCRFK